MSDIKKLNAVLDSFPVFLTLTWKHLELPRPTEAQLEMARFLQSDNNRIVIQAFRGIGKSYITSAYVCWCLLKDPQIKVMVVSATKVRADNFSRFCLKLIREMPLLKHLAPRSNQRQSYEQFDVAGANAAHAPSVKSVGVFGQMEGSRGDIIIADDVEIAGNSFTNDQREKLLSRTAEFDAILKPGGSIKILGTPQSMDSIYNKFKDKGFLFRIWPALYPPYDEMDDVYGGSLAPRLIEELRNAHESGTTSALVGTAVDPERFDVALLEDRRISMGKANFQLQFQLNTILSDADKYPLKTQNAIVMPMNPFKAPLQLQWSCYKSCKLQELPNVGLRSDAWYKPLYADETLANYSGKVMAIDPAGRGADETTYAIVAYLNGFLHVLDVGGFRGGYEDEVLISLAQKLKQYDVKQCVIEANFGDGMFTKLFTPFANKYGQPCNIDEVKHHIQKERRICDTLEPLLGAHKLVFNYDLVNADTNGVLENQHVEGYCEYSLFYQMTRLTRERNALKHDDKIDVLAIACNYWTEQMDISSEKAAIKIKDRERQQLLDDFCKDFRSQSKRKAYCIKWDDGNKDKKQKRSCHALNRLLKRK